MTELQVRVSAEFGRSEGGLPIMGLGQDGFLNRLIGTQISLLERNG